MHIICAQIIEREMRAKLMDRTVEEVGEAPVMIMVQWILWEER